MFIRHSLVVRPFSSFCPRPPTLYTSFLSLTLAFFLRVMQLPLLDTELIILLEHTNHLTVLTKDTEFFCQCCCAGLLSARPPTLMLPFISSPFSSFPPLYTFAHSVLLSTALDTLINNPPGLTEDR